MKVLVLILSSDGGVYTELQRVWRSYLHKFPETFEIYFYKAVPTLESEWKFDNDILFVKCPENLGSVARKLQLALKAFESRLDEFDYVFRPNLSSFIIVDRYLEALGRLPLEAACMAKEHLKPAIFPTGAGFTITRDIVRAIIAAPFKQRIHGGDDVAVGDLLQTMKIKITDVPRIDVTDARHHAAYLVRIRQGPNIFHIRVKHDCANRIPLDLGFHKSLLKEYYDIDF
jgi:hypothetical protein